MKPQQPFVIFIMSIIGILLGFKGIEYLFAHDYLIGFPLMITGFIGGILELIQYRKKLGSNHKSN